MARANSATPDAPAEPLAGIDLDAAIGWLREHRPDLFAPVVVSDPPTTVTEALCRVMADLPGIGKDAVSPQGYNYRGIEAITQHAQHIFARYGVVFAVPKIVERKTIELMVNGKPWTEEQLTLVYTAYGPSHGKVREMRIPTFSESGLVNGVVTIDEVVNDSIEIGPLLGLGRDNSDKGANKALTQAYKYALIQTLCIGDSKDDPDSQRAAETDAPGQRGWWGGWETEEEMHASRNTFKETMKERVAAGRMTEAEAKDAWARYQTRPDGKAGYRSRPEHDEFLAEIFAEAPAATEPSAAPVAEQAPPEAPKRPQPAKKPDGQLPPVPPDNGFRNRLDEILADGGVDGMIAELKRLDVEAVVAELQQRGAALTGGEKVSEVRQMLGAILLSRAAGSPEAADSPQEPTGDPGATDTASDPAGSSQPD